MRSVLAVDPGVKKCGLLIADLDLGLVIDGRVVGKNSVLNLITVWKENALFEDILLGNGTSSKYWAKVLREFGSLELVEERGTTLLARRRYWELWPPGKLFAWLPRSLFIPPQHLDAVAALVLLENHLGKKLSWPVKPNFRIVT